MGRGTGARRVFTRLRGGGVAMGMLIPTDWTEIVDICKMSDKEFADYIAYNIAKYTEHGQESNGDYFINRNLFLIKVRKYYLGKE